MHAHFRSGRVSIHGVGTAEISRVTSQGIAKAALRSAEIKDAKFASYPGFVTNVGNSKNTFSLRVAYHGSGGANFSLIPACQGKGFQPLAQVSCAVEGHPHLSITSVFDASSGRHSCQLSIDPHDALSTSPLVVTASVSHIGSSSSSSAGGGDRKSAVARAAITAAPAFAAEASAVSLGRFLAAAATLRVQHVLDVAQLGVELDSDSLLPDAGSTSEFQYFTSATLRVTLSRQPRGEVLVTLERMMVSQQEHTLTLVNKLTKQRHVVAVEVSDDEEPQQQGACLYGSVCACACVCDVKVSCVLLTMGPRSYICDGTC